MGRFLHYSEYACFPASPGLEKPPGSVKTFSHSATTQFTIRPSIGQEGIHIRGVSKPASISLPTCQSYAIAILHRNIFVWHTAMVETSRCTRFAGFNNLLRDYLTASSPWEHPSYRRRNAISGWSKNSC
jgi:hypothetical protein